MKKGDLIRAALADDNPKAITFDGCDSALLGIARQHCGVTVACYSRKKLIEHFYKQFGSYEEAEEWVCFNIDCLAVTGGTPVIVQDSGFN